MTEVIDLTLEHLDFEHEPPCEVMHCEPLPAEFLVIFACCGHAMYYCQKDLDSIINWVNGGGGTHCDLCGVYDIKGNPFSLIERIKNDTPAR